MNKYGMYWVDNVVVFHHSIQICNVEVHLIQVDGCISEKRDNGHQLGQRVEPHDENGAIGADRLRVVVVTCVVVVVSCCFRSTLIISISTATTQKRLQQINFDNCLQCEEVSSFSIQSSLNGRNET